MKLRSIWVWAAAAGIVAAGAGAAMASGLTAGLNAAAVDAGLRAYAWAADLGRRVPMGLFLPVIAMTVSFHVGSRMGRRIRRPEARAVAVPAQPPVLRTVLLFGLAALISLVFMAANGLLY